MATFNGTIADSAHVLIMHETRLPNVYYFPRGDVRMEFLQRSTHRTNCPFKGNATHWSLTVGDRTVENAAWSYEEAFDEAASVTGYVAFYWGAGGPLVRRRRGTDRTAARHEPVKTTPSSAGSSRMPRGRHRPRICSPASPGCWSPRACR